MIKGFLNNLKLKEWLLNVTTSEDWIRIDTVADSAKTSTGEMIRALIYWAYYLPHTQWDEILKNYRERKKGQ